MVRTVRSRRTRCGQCLGIAVAFALGIAIGILAHSDGFVPPYTLFPYDKGSAGRAQHASSYLPAESSQQQHLVWQRGRLPRLLFMTASYTQNQFSSLQKTLDCMRDHCNAGWNVTVVIQTAYDFDKASDPRYEELRDRLYCATTKENMPLIIEPFGKIGFGLNSRHRIYLRAHVHEYDYFSYAEEDMLLTVSHMTAYLQAERELKMTFPKTWVRYQIGFLRWEDSSAQDCERVSWEYFPDKIHAVDIYKGNQGPEPRRPLQGIYIVTNNLNQAIYVLSREHVLDLDERCAFLTDIGQNPFFRELRRAMDKDWKYLSAGVSEWSSSYQQILQCGLRRLVPAEHIQSYMIHHAENKAQKRRLRSELLTARDWLKIVAEKAKAPITVEEAYNEIIYHQYNLHLIEPQKFAGASSWSWGVEVEQPHIA